MKLAEKLSDKLQKRKDDNALRKLSIFENYEGEQSYKLDFFSNDYLGLARIEFENNGSLGSTGSRLLSGNSEYAERLEQKLATFYQQEAGLILIPDLMQT